MKKNIYLVLVLFVLSCDVFKKHEDHVFVYGFENEKEITEQEFLETIDVIKRRLKLYGVNFEIKKTRNKKINLKINAHNLDDKRVNKIIINEGKLEFWELYRGEDFFPFIIELNSSLIDKKENDSVKFNPLLDLVASRAYQGGPAIFNVKSKDTATFTSLLNKKESKLYLPSEYPYVKFLWGVSDGNGHHPLYVAKSNRENKAPLSGESIVDAIQNYGVIGRPTILISMDNDGALRWERITGTAFEKGTCIAITLNNVVYSAPGVTTGAIKGGRSEVSGNFTLEEAQDLAIVLSSQKRIPKLKLLEYSKLLE